MRTYYVTVHAVNDRRWFHLGTGIFRAKSEKDAEVLGMERFWDERLSCTDCSPIVEATDIEKSFEDMPD